METTHSLENRKVKLLKTNFSFDPAPKIYGKKIMFKNKKQKNKTPFFSVFSNPNIL